MEALALALEELGLHTTLVAAGDAVKDSLVIVDSYRLRADDRERFRGEVVAAVDDLQRNLAVDLVIDPCPGADQVCHGSARRVLLGPRFAPLDPRLTLVKARPPAQTVEQVVISAGGSSTTVGIEIAAQLVARLTAVRIRLALGPWSGDGNINGVEIVRTTSGLVPELAGADLVVTAAGVTMLEALALARPTVAFILAENQRLYAEGVARAGAAVVCELSRVADAAAGLAADPDRRRTLSAAAGDLVDAHGARRVAEELRTLV